MRFAGKKVLVTGACGVFGAWIAAAFAREGATLCLSDGRADALKEATAKLGGATLSHATELTDEDSILALMRLLRERWRAPDVVVNNAGIRRDAIVGMMREDDWKRVLEVNLDGTFHVSKLAVMASCDSASLSFR